MSLFPPHDFEYLSEQEEKGYPPRMAHLDRTLLRESREENDEIVICGVELEKRPPLVVFSRRESGNDHSTATSHSLKISRKSHGIKKKEIPTQRGEPAVRKSLRGRIPKLRSDDETFDF
jgi:hypothetical protein